MSALPITTVKTIVERIEDDGDGIKVFTLVDPDRWELPPFRPGAHVDLHLPGGLVRTYSLCNDSAHNAQYVVAVKREGEGVGRGGSMALHDQIRTGDVIGVSLPRGGLALDHEISCFVFVAGGIGVTPFLSAATRLTQERRTNFVLHVIARGNPPPLTKLLAPLMKIGNVVLHDTTIAARPKITDLIGPPRPGVALACCGPVGMIDDFEQASRDWPADRVHIERFVPPPLRVDVDAKPYILALARSKLEILVAPGQTMLSALTEMGIDIPASCCGGICGSCKVDWLEGQPVHRDRALSPTERERSLLVCVAGSAKDRLVLDL